MHLPVSTLIKYQIIWKTQNRMNRKDTETVVHYMQPQMAHLGEALP